MTEQTWEGSFSNHPNTNTEGNEMPIDYVPATVVESKSKAIGRPITEEFVSSIGNESGKNLATFAARVLEQQKNSDSGDMGEKLNQLIDVSKDLSADKLKTGKLQKIVNKALRIKDRAVARFDTAKDRVDVLVNQMSKERDLQVKQARNVDILIEGNYNYCKSLIQDIVIAKEALEQVDAELAVLPEEADNLDDAHKRSDLQNLSDKLGKKIVDLESFKILSMEYDPKLSQMRRTASSLVGTFDDVTTKLIPMYQQYFAGDLISQSQTGAIDLQNKMFDTFNETVKSASSSNAKNVEAMARLNQRQAVNVDTIKQLHEDTVGSLQKVRAIEQEAREARKVTIVELKRLEQETIAAYAKK